MEAKVDMFSGKKQVDPAGFLLKRTKELVHRVRAKKVSTLVFLDKSARPLAGFFLYFWRKKYPNIKPPQVKFINIGRYVKPKISSDRDRKLFSIFRKSIFAGNSNPKILIVDELSSSGGTASKAIHFLQTNLNIGDVDYFEYLDVHPYTGSTQDPLDIFPWLIGQRRNKLLIDSVVQKDNEEDLFVKPVGDIVDKVEGIEMRKKIRKLFEY